MAVTTAPADATLEFLDTLLISGATIILDIDGTITADAKADISAGVARAIQSLTHRNAVYLFSNHEDDIRNQEVARRLGLPFLDTLHRKPSRKVIEAIPACHRDRPLVVIGDRFTTDGLFARRTGARFIKVGRVLSSSDRKFTKFAYFIDDCVAWILTKGRRLSFD